MDQGAEKYEIQVQTDLNKIFVVISIKTKQHTRKFFFLIITMVAILSFDVGVKNLAYCLFTYDSLTEFEIQEWDIIDLSVGSSSSEQKCRKLTLNDQSDILLKKLKELFEVTDIDYIIIENQPVLKNPTMKTIQMIIYTYFRILKTNDGKYIEDVVLVNANNKVRFADNVLSKVPNIDLELPPPPSSKDGSRGRYKRNKEVAVTATKRLLERFGSDDTLAFFTSCKKKDDLADTLLQGLYFGHSVCS